MSSTQAERVAERMVDEVPSFSEATKAARDALRVASRKATATFNDLSGEALETGAKAREQIVRQVESQPMTAILLAAGVGLLAGLLWARR